MSADLVYFIESLSDDDILHLFEGVEIDLIDENVVRQIASAGASGAKKGARVGHDFGKKVGGHVGTGAGAVGGFVVGGQIAAHQQRNIKMGAAGGAIVGGAAGHYIGKHVGRAIGGGVGAVAGAVGRATRTAAQLATARLRKLRGGKARMESHTFMEAFGKKEKPDEKKGADSRSVPNKEGKAVQPDGSMAKVSDKAAVNTDKTGENTGKKPFPGKEPAADKAGKKPPFGKAGAKQGKDVTSGTDTDMSSGKPSTPEIKEKVKVEFNPRIEEELVAALDYISEGDISDVDQDILEQFKEDFLPLLSELSIATRMKKRLTMKRYARKIAQRRQRTLARRATEPQIMKRARRSAIDTLKTRFSGGRSPEELTISDKNRVERMIAQRKDLVSRFAKRLTRTERQIDRERLNK